MAWIMFRFLKWFILQLLCTSEINCSVENSVLPSVDPLPDGAYTSYLKGPVCQPSEPIRYPKTIEEIVSIVQEAIRKNTTVKAVGSRHSTTDIICTKGIPIAMTKIVGLKMNDDRTTVRTGAGATLRAVTTFLRKHNRALRSTPAFGNITVGGAIGTGAHGSSVRYNSSVSEQMIGATIVDGLGKVRYINSSEDLKAFKIHLGLLGILVEITLATEVLYKVHAHNYLMDDKVMVNGELNKIVQNTDQITVYWFPTYSKILIANWTIVDVNTPGNATTNDHVPPTSKGFNAFSAPAFEVFQTQQSFEGFNLLSAFTLQSMLTDVPNFVPIYTEDGKKTLNPAVGFYDVMFAPTCNAEGNVQCSWLHGPNNNVTFMDNEITVPMEKIKDFTETIKDILTKANAIFPFDGILLRFSKASEIYMSASEGADACHFEFYQMKRKNPYEDPSLGLNAYQTIMQSMGYKFNGRAHWAKSGPHYHSQEMLLKKLDPAARKAFIAKMNEYDPNGVFHNSFARRLLGVGTESDIDPATKHCALLDNCICSKDSDCATKQICTRLEGYPDYPVCSYPDQKPVPLNPDHYKLTGKEIVDKLGILLKN